MPEGKKDETVRRSQVVARAADVPTVPDHFLYYCMQARSRTTPIEGGQNFRDGATVKYGIIKQCCDQSEQKIFCTPTCDILRYVYL